MGVKQFYVFVLVLTQLPLWRNHPGRRPEAKLRSLGRWPPFPGGGSCVSQGLSPGVGTARPPLIPGLHLRGRQIRCGWGQRAGTSCCFLPLPLWLALSHLSTQNWPNGQLSAAPFSYSRWPMANRQGCLCQEQTGPANRCVPEAGAEPG